MRFSVNKKTDLRLEDRRRRSCVGPISYKVRHRTIASNKKKGIVTDEISQEYSDLELKHVDVSS